MTCSRMNKEQKNMAELNLTLELPKEKLPANIGDFDRLESLASMLKREPQIVFLLDANSNRNYRVVPFEQKTRDQNVTFVT